MSDIVFNGIRQRIKDLLEVMDEKESPVQITILKSSLPILDSIEKNLNQYENIWADDLIKQANNRRTD